MNTTKCYYACCYINVHFPRNLNFTMNGKYWKDCFNILNTVTIYFMAYLTKCNGGEIKYNIRITIYVLFISHIMKISLKF